MDKKVLEQIKEQLEKRKSQIIKDLEAVEAPDGEAKFPEYGDKPDENAQEVGNYVTNMAAEQSLEKSLEDINNALERIKKGIYGVCKYCEQEIDEKRLLARPAASACIECKTKLQS